MPTTGLATFTMSRDEMIKASLRLLTELGVGEVPVAEDYTNCNQALNLVLKSWQKKGAVLWTYDELEIPMVTGITTYPIGPTAGYLTPAGFTITNGGTGGVDGTYALDITDLTGDHAVGTFVVAGGTITTITITTAGDSYTAPTFDFTAASITGETVTCRVVGLTTNRPLRVIDAFLRTDSTVQDIPLICISRQEYNRLGAKSTRGYPNQFYYDNQLDNGLITFYNPPISPVATPTSSLQSFLNSQFSQNASDQPSAPNQPPTPISIPGMKSWRMNSDWTFP